MKNYIIIGLIALISFFIIQNLRLKDNIQDLNIQYYNEIARSDTLTQISDLTWTKLSEIRSERDLAQEEIKALGKELEGKSRQVIRLHGTVSELKGLLNQVEPVKSDTIYINNIMKNRWTYEFNENTENYSFNSDIRIIGNTKPDSISMDYNIVFKPIKVEIFTSKLEPIGYRVTVKSSSELFTLTNAELMIAEDKYDPWWRRLELGGGIGVSSDGFGYLATGMKLDKHAFTTTYSGSNGNFGLQYMHYLKW